MFCGKTTELMRRMRRHQHAGRGVLLVKYAADTRYSDECAVVTHDKHTTEAHASVCCLGDVVLPPGIDIVLIDEVQFMPDAVEVCERWANAGIVVICAGLDSDWRREPFAVISRLAARAECVDKLTAVCVRCKSDAAHWTHRTVTSDALELIGGGEAYEPLCRQCWPH